MEENQKEKDSWGDLLRFGILILLVVIPFRIFIAQPYLVEGASMDPTFKDGDYLIVDQVSYRFKNPARGSVIIFKYPKDPSKDFIKRVVGLPGETISIRNGGVFIKNESGEIKLEEPYIKFPKYDDLEITLKESEYFVMGDNRAGSSDSRYWGPLPEKDIVGRFLFRLLPINSLDAFPGDRSQ